MEDTSLPTVGFIKLATILRIFPISKSSWFAGIQSGIYPKPVKLGKRSSGWNVDDIRDLILRMQKNDLDIQK